MQKGGGGGGGIGSEQTVTQKSAMNMAFVIDIWFKVTAHPSHTGRFRV